MTTVKDLRDIVYFKYMVEKKRRKEPETKIGDGEFNVYYNIVKQEIFQRLSIGYITQTIALTPVTVFTEYALTNTFGGLENYQMTLDDNASDLELKNIAELPTTGGLTSGTPNKIAIYAKNDGLHYVYLYPLVSTAGSLAIRYKVTTEISAAFGRGYDLSTLNIEVPLQYQPLLIDGIMGQLFPDMQEIYYQKLKRAEYYRATPVKASLTYDMGGLDGEPFDNGFSKNFNGES